MGLSERLSADPFEFLTLAELRPPKGVVLEPLVELAGRLRGRVDGLLVPENASAIMAMSPLVVARRLAEVGHEVVLGLSCRDHNRLALQSILLGAHAEGLHQVLVTAGGDPAYGDHPRAKAVWDLTPPEVLSAMRRLAEGVDLTGSPVEGALSFEGGAELDPFLEGEERKAELAEVERRVGAGARFLMTPAVHDLSRFDEAVSPFRHFGVPIIARVMLLKSVGMARYLNRNVAGDEVPPETIRALRAAPDKGEASIRLARELARGLEPLCQGVCYVPLGWEDRLPALLDLA